MSRIYWKYFMPMLIVLSLILNIAFIGGWSYRFVGEQLRSVSSRSSNEGIWCPLHRALNVSDEQWRILEPKLIMLQQEIAQFCEVMEVHRREMIGIIFMDNPDLDAIEKKKEVIRNHQANMQEVVISHLLAEKKVLTNKQEAQLFEMMLENNVCAGPGRMFSIFGQGTTSE